MVNFCKPKAEFRNVKLIFNQVVKFINELANSPGELSCCK